MSNSDEQKTHSDAYSQARRHRRFRRREDFSSWSGQCPETRYTVLSSSIICSTYQVVSPLATEQPSAQTLLQNPSPTPKTRPKPYLFIYGFVSLLSFFFFPLLYACDRILRVKNVFHLSLQHYSAAQMQFYSCLTSAHLKPCTH